MSRSVKQQLRIQAVLFSAIVLGLSAIVMLSGDRTKPAVAFDYYPIETACCDEVCSTMTFALSASGACEAWDDAGGILVYDEDGWAGEGWYGHASLDPTWEIHCCGACRIDFVLKPCDEFGTWPIYWSCNCGEVTSPPDCTGEPCDVGWYQFLYANYDCSLISGACYDEYGFGGNCACGGTFGVYIDINTSGFCQL